MLQIRKLREYTPKGQTVSEKYDSPLDPDLVFPNIESLLTNLQDTIDKIPESERYNLFCTLHNQPDDALGREKRIWGKQELIMFDIDGITFGKDELYLQVIASALKVAPTAILQILSGGGYHFLVKLKDPIKDISFFDKNRLYYQVLCSRINDLLQVQGLLGAADANVFAPKFLFRLPLTLNRKPNREPLWVKLLHSHIEPIDLDLREVSGLPKLSDDDFMSEKELSYIKIDTSSVETGCEFLKFAKENQPSMSEPQWYAMLSILGRLEGGREKAHEYSKFHPDYTHTHTERKLEQSLKTSGPRTCDNVNSVWGSCKTCPHYKKIRSPISIKGVDFIATEYSGFHAIGLKGNLTPQYDDLRKYYQKKMPYLNVNDTHYQYLENYWQERTIRRVEEFAQDSFLPVCNNTMSSEFKGIIQRTNIREPNFFSESTDRHLNLRNGILNIDTMKLLPHSHEYGFRHLLPFDYDPQAECPTFEKMLGNVTLGDKALQDILLEFMGYALSNDDPRADKILILTGDGQNGKSRFLNILRALGGDHVTYLGVKDLANSFKAQRLDGAFFNIMEEVPPFADSEFWEMLKNLSVGGDITVEEKFKRPYDFKNKAKLIMTCNELPKGITPDFAHFRRLIIVPFNAKFSHELGNIDITIDKRVIENELAGVLNRVLKAYHALFSRGYVFTASPLVDRAISEYRENMDSVARFAIDHLQAGESPKGLKLPEWMKPDKEGRICADLQLMYMTYNAWCKSNGEHPVSFNPFSKRLRNAFSLNKNVEVRRVRTDVGLRQMMYGVTWCGELLI